MECSCCQFISGLIIMLFYHGHFSISFLPSPPCFPGPHVIMHGTLTTAQETTTKLKATWLRRWRCRLMNFSSKIDMTKCFDKVNQNDSSNLMLDVSDGIHDINTVKWELAGCLLLAWIVVYIALWKGIKSIGKVWYPFDERVILLPMLTYI